MRGLTGDKRGITRIRSTWIKWEGRLCMPILHPAYLLRNHDYSKDGPWALTQKDLKAVKRRLNQLESDDLDDKHEVLRCSDEFNTGYLGSDG